MNNIKILPMLLVFAEVAKQQSFTLAAKQLGMSKSTISQQVKRLEQQLGQQLLSRHTRGMSLTAAGRKLLDRCELLKGQVDLALEALDNTKESPSGPFSLTIPHTCERDIVVPALSQLCLEFPKIEPQITVTDETLDLIQDNLDVAIYAGTLKDSSYRALPITTVNEIFVATPAYIQKHGRAKKPDDLNNYRMISAAWQNNPLAIFENNKPHEKLSFNANFFVKTNTMPTVLEMVLHDMGMALLPKFVLQAEMEKGRLIQVLPEYQGRQWPFYMVHRFQGEKPIHITRFYQLVKHFFEKRI